MVRLKLSYFPFCWGYRGLNKCGLYIYVLRKPENLIQILFRDWFRSRMGLNVTAIAQKIPWRFPQNPYSVEAENRGTFENNHLSTR
jgi:hypothetical protein